MKRVCTNWKSRVIIGIILNKISRKLISWNIIIITTSENPSHYKGCNKFIILIALSRKVKIFQIKQKTKQKY